MAESAARLTGTTLVGRDGRRGLIPHLAVATDQRRSGLGRRRDAAGLAARRAQGIYKCHLMLFADNAGGAACWTAIGALRRNPSPRRRAALPRAGFP